MDTNHTPERPDSRGTSGNGPTPPRVEVEPTPDAGATNPAGAHASGEYNSSEHAAGAHAAGTHAAGATEHIPYVPSTASETRTVVKTRTKKLPVFLAALGGFVLGGILLIALVMSGAFRITDSDVQAAGDSAAQTIKIDAEDATLAEAVAAKALPSVVSITTETQDGGGVGSGVILDADGNILTNYHVIEGATAIAVNVDDDASYEAEIVGTDESSDLAVIRITDKGDAQLTPIEIGDSDNLTVGEWVMAIGSPFGNEQSVSTGIVSALYRSTAMQSSTGTTIYANMIQTDAAINPGNSGGALVDSEGKLVGINSIIESYSGSSSGVGFAIPINYAINIANQIIAGETPVHPYLGVSVTSVNAFVARRENLSVSEGALISQVNEGTPAAEAGLEVNDIVTAVDDEPVTSADGLIMALREHEVGDKVTLTVVRGDETKKIDVTLGSDADLQTDQQDTSSGNGAMTEEDFLQYLQELMGQNGGNLGGQIG